jgi:hypothetical protein
MKSSPVIQSSCMEEDRKAYKVLVGKPKGRSPLGRPRRRRENGIRMDLREIGWGGVDWIRLAQDRDQWRAVVSAVMNLRVLVPQSYKYLVNKALVSHIMQSWEATCKQNTLINRFNYTVMSCIWLTRYTKEKNNCVAPNKYSISVNNM